MNRLIPNPADQRTAIAGRIADLQGCTNLSQTVEIAAELLGPGHLAIRGPEPSLVLLEDGEVEVAVGVARPVMDARLELLTGGAELSALHDRVDDRDWLELGAIADDERYIARFRKIFGVDIST